jgi:hypothetical protein
MTKYFLYHSTKCEHCKMLVKIIKTEEDLNSSIKLICIDVINGKRNPLVKLNNIKEVPSLIIDNGGGYEMYSGSSAFNVIEKMLSSRQPQGQQQGQQQGQLQGQPQGQQQGQLQGQQQGQQQGQGGGGPVHEISGYSATFSGLSDSFSTYGEEKPDPLERSFGFLNEGSKGMMISDKQDSTRKSSPNEFETLLKEREQLNQQQQKM